MRRMAFVLTVLLMVADMAVAGSGKDIVAASGVKGGLIVHIGCGDGKLTAELRVNDRYLVHGLDTNPANVDKARKYLLSHSEYGKVSAARLTGSRLPYTDNLVNLIVSESPSRIDMAEMMRVLAPGGATYLKKNGKWTKTVKPRPDNIDEWTHFLHGPDNNAVAADSVAANPRSIQWVSGPRWGRSHEELASMSTAVTAGGRTFYIVDEAPLISIRYSADWKLVARDAFNGILLWKKDIPLWNDHLRHFRSGPVHLHRRLVAVGDKVFVTLGLDAAVSCLDAATGKTLSVYKGTEHTEEIMVDGGVLYLAAGTSEVNRMGEGLHERGEPKPTGFRCIMAVNADTGRQLWKNNFSSNESLLPLTLAVRDGSVYYQSTAGIVRLDGRSGKEIWTAPRRTIVKRMGFLAPTLVITDDVVLNADRTLTSKDPSADQSGGAIQWGIHGWTAAGFARKGKNAVIAYSVKDGRQLWTAEATEGYNSPVDIFVVGQTVWIGADYKGYDLKTGKLKKELDWKGPAVGMAHHRCYRNKATEDYIFTGRSGVEVVSYEDGWLANNSWLRGTCQFGIMPGNGLLYVPPDACGCFPKVRTPGFFAAAPKRGPDLRMPFGNKKRLEKGPAYNKISNIKYKISNREDWPTYRHDAARSGTSSTRIPSSLKKAWSTSLGGKLTQPVISNGMVFVASTDTHTVHAMKADSGRELWTYTAGGRIDSSPTLHNGMVLFGCADGWIYSLRATNGQLVWRFLAAPEERLVTAFGQLESTWPVHGAVLVQNGTLYATAGRSTYLDGGIVLYRIDPATGAELSRTVSTSLDPDTGEQLAKEGGAAGLKFDMEGTTSDILSGDGDSVFLKHYHYNRLGKQTDAEKPHLFAMTGFLGEDWFVRSYWLVGTTTGAGWGGWASAANQAPFGRILSVADDKIYGYGRTEIQSGATGHTADAYHLFAKEKLLISTKPLPKAPRGSKNQPATRTPKPKPAETYWSDDESLMVRAMALAGDKLVVAGPTDPGKKRQDLLEFTNEKEAFAAFTGQKGAYLRVVSAKDGKTLSELKLDAIPAFDAIAAANNRIYMATTDGKVHCFAGKK